MSGHETALLIGIVGSVVVLSFLVKAALQRVGIPGMVGFLLIGVGISFGDSATGFLPSKADAVLEFLAQLGIISLLFGVGLKSNLVELVRQLKSAAGIWVLDVLFSTGVAWAVAHYVLELSLVPSLFVTVAMAATSVGVPLAVWREANALDTDEGRIFLDVAELDDISTIVLMALLFVGIPVLMGGSDADLASTLGGAGLEFFLKFGLFVAGAYVFSAYIEEPLTDLFERFEHKPDPMLSVVGIGVIIAALADSLGLSVAVGAFLAGLAFSRDPDVVKNEASFESLYEFFVPFFFVNIGMMIRPDGLLEALPIGGVLLIAAATGKFMAGTIGSWRLLGLQKAVLLGISLMPRAEVAMIVMQEGSKLGEDALPAKVFAGMVIVSAATCLISPALVRRQLIRLHDGDAPPTPAG